jgi:hypothetical protein
MSETVELLSFYSREFHFLIPPKTTGSDFQRNYPSSSFSFSSFSENIQRHLKKKVETNKRIQNAVSVRPK